MNKGLIVDGVGVGVGAREESDDLPGLPGLARDDSIHDGIHDSIQAKDFGPVDESQGQ